MINYYSILEVPESATQSEIKAAFKRLAVCFHPDKHSGNPEMEERFKEVNQAYQVLSNPYEKARYDLQMQYGQSTSYYAPPQPPPRPPRPKNYRPRYKEPEINWKENWIATGYAFAFTFIMAAIVMTGITIKNYIDEKNLEELLTKRRNLFEEAQGKYRVGQVDDAMITLNSLGNFMEQEQDMETYKEKLLESFIYEAEHHYNRGIYEDAIYYYELIENYAPRNPLPLKEHLAMSYRKAGQPDRCLKVIKELLIVNYRKMELYLLMAEIERDDLNDIEDARRYFEVASDLAIERYKAIYGEAYPLMITARSLPDAHYHLYTGLADIYLQTKAYDRAVKATKWNINVWPDSVQNYVIAAKGYAMTNRSRQACEKLTEARSLGFAAKVNFNCP